MSKTFHGPIRGVISISACFFNTLFWAVPILVVSGFKLLLPVKSWHKGCTRVLNYFAGCWVGGNKTIQRMFHRVKWDIRGLENLPRDGWYLVLANHQSWVDIVVLQNIFHRRIPFLKFFLKKELFWYPVIGLCWWALDFPFIKRYTAKFLAQNPHLKGKDIETTLKACNKFSQLPVSVMNFVEGTRFTREKHAGLKSPYTNLLRPRAAGIALVISGLSDKLHRIIDVTIVYPGNVKGFWPFACGEIGEIKVHIEALPVTEDLVGDYAADRKFRVRFQGWLNQRWEEKDHRIDRMLGHPAFEPEPFLSPEEQRAAEPAKA